MEIKNRSIIFGYRFENGRIVVDNTEAKIVNQVFTDYVNGLSLLKITNLLIQNGIEYLPNQVKWSKNKIRRIIENKKYLGDDTYPQIVDTDIFYQANSIKDDRDTTKNTDRSNYIYKLKIPVLCSECNEQMKRKRQANKEITEKWICSECGHSINIFDGDLISEINDMLNYLIHNPTLIKSDAVSNKSLETIRTENEINRMLEIADVDKNILQQKIFELATLKYADLDSGSYISKQIKSEFENAEELTEISLPLLMKTTQAIQLNTNAQISLVLKNNQIIGKEKGYGTENSQVHSTDNNNTIRYEESISSGKSGSILPSIYKAG